MNTLLIIGIVIVVIVIAAYMLGAFSSPQQVPVPMLIRMTYNPNNNKIGMVSFSDAEGKSLGLFDNGITDTVNTTTFNIPGFEGLLVKMTPNGKIVGIKSIIISGKAQDLNYGDYEGTEATFWSRPDPTKLLINLTPQELYRRSKK